MSFNHQHQDTKEMEIPQRTEQAYFICYRK